MKKITLIIINIILMLTLFTNFCYAGMADMTDAQSDAQAKIQEEEQRKKDDENKNKSSDNYLESLSVEGFEIYPSFNKQIIDYSINKTVDVNEVNIVAKASNDKAVISGIGKVSLQSGENKLKVDVTAENGIMRSYFIKINKEVKKDALKLNKLNLKAIGEVNYIINLNPDFSSDVFLYSCEVNSDVEKIDVDVGEKMNVDISGNEKLQEGNNTITIKLKENNNETIYKINVYKKAKGLQINSSDENSNKKAIIITIIIIIMVLILYTFIKKKNKRKKHSK